MQYSNQKRWMRMQREKWIVTVVLRFFTSFKAPEYFLWVFKTRERWSKCFPPDCGGLLVCDGVSVWNLSPLWSTRPVFTFYPDRLHKMEPKHQTDKMEGVVAAWRIKSNLLSSLHLPTSSHPFIHPSSTPLLSQHSTTSFPPKKPLTTPPPSAFSMSLPVPGTTSESCCPFINLPLSFPVCLSVSGLLCKGWKIHEWFYCTTHYSCSHLFPLLSRL